MYYVKITDEHFFPDMYPLDAVVPCNEVFAKWVIDHDYGVITDSEGTPITSPLYTPVILSGLVKDAAPADLIINFSTDIAVTDDTGIGVSVNDVVAAITSVSATGRALTVVMTTPIAAGEGIKFAYDGAIGNITNADWVALKAVSGSVDVSNEVVAAVAVSGGTPTPIIAPPDPGPYLTPPDPFGDSPLAPDSP